MMKKDAATWSPMCLVAYLASAACAPLQAGTFGQPDASLPTDRADAVPPTPALEPLAIDLVSPAVIAETGGEVVNIMGSGFRPDSIVSIGEVLATEVSALSNTLLRARTPTNRGMPGPVLLRIENPDGTQALSRTLLSYAGTLGSPPVARLYPLSDVPLAMASGDVNHDGQDDLLVLTRGSLNVLLSNGSSPLAVTASYSHKVSAITANELLLGDYNQDGNLDVAFAGQSIYIQYGNTRGAFSPAVTYEALEQSYYTSITTQDWNADGAMDITGLGKGGELRSLLGPLRSGSGRCEMLLTYGGGWMQARTDRPGSPPALLVLQASTGLANRLPGLGTGCFDVSTANNAPGTTGVADIVRLVEQPDSLRDPTIIQKPPRCLCQMNYSGYCASSSNAICPQIGTIDKFLSANYWSFALASQLTGMIQFISLYGQPGNNAPLGPAISVPGTPLALASGDFNRDGKRDLAIAIGPGNSVGILFGNGLGGFTWSS